MAPDVPPIAEFIPGFDFAPTIGIYARTGTPPAIMRQDRRGGRRDRQGARDHQGSSPTAGIEPAGAGPKEYAEELKREDERVAKTVKAAGMKPQGRKRLDADLRQQRSHHVSTVSPASPVRARLRQKAQTPPARVRRPKTHEL